jgi:CDP-diglyceride synthetase
MTSSLLFALWFFSPAGIANAAPILAAKTPGLRRFNTPLDLGFLLALGALLGDLIKSMVKRRVGVPSGRSWFPYDQLDYIIGGLLLSACVVVLHASQYVWVVFVYFGVHLLASYIGYLLKLKDSPI